MRGAGLEDRLDINIIAGAAQKLAAGEVAQDCGERVHDGGKDALRLFLASKAETAVHAGDDKVKALQNVRRVVERAIGEDVGFDAFENAKASTVAAVEGI